jgi:hypothetical protein
MRKGKSITTYSKLEFWPLDPRESEILPMDIAHALSMLCRANGHYSHFYSVAQHSIYCSLEAKARGLSKEIQLASLLHDASEAYISDITRPVKSLLPKYLEIEDQLQSFIYKCFGLTKLTEDDLRLVTEIDDAMLNLEMKVLLDSENFNGLDLVGEYDLSFRNMNVVRDEFLERLTKLTHNI